MAYGTMTIGPDVYRLAEALYDAAWDYRHARTEKHAEALDSALAAYAGMVAGIAERGERARAASQELLAAIQPKSAGWANDYARLRDTMGLSPAMLAALDETYGYTAKECAE